MKNNLNRAIHYGGKLHGQILHNATIPPSTKRIGKCFLLVHTNSPLDQEYHDTITAWNRLLSDPKLFIGPSIKQKRGLMEHKPER